MPPFQSIIQGKTVLKRIKIRTIEPTLRTGKTMRSKQSRDRKIIRDAFTITEHVRAVAIIRILSSVAIPSYVGQLCRSESAEAESTVCGIKTIITSYIDETSTLPTSWDALSDISVIMSNNGIAKGNLSTAITLPNEKYTVSITGPTDSTYESSALRTDGCPNQDIIACIELSKGGYKIKAERQMRLSPMGHLYEL